MTALIGSRPVRLVLTIALAAGACTGDAPPPEQRASGGDSVAVARPSAEPDETTQAIDTQQDDSIGDAVDVAAGNGGVAVLRAVRVGRHQGYERITFEFEGDSMPGYRVEYVDPPVHACGSGAVVPLSGEVFLSIRLYPAAAHTEAGQPTIAQREMAFDHPIIRQLKRTCDFEAVVVFVTGQSKRASFSTQVFRSPLRLVVDLRD